MMRLTVEKDIYAINNLRNFGYTASSIESEDKEKIVYKVYFFDIDKIIDQLKEVGIKFSISTEGFY